MLGIGMDFKHLSYFFNFLLIVTVFNCFIGSNSYAAPTNVSAKMQKYVVFTGWARSFSNIRTNGDITESQVPNGYEASLDFRLAPMISLTSAYGKSLENNYAYYGGGLRIDLPGFLIFGWKSNDYTKQKKRFPLNTSIHGEVLKFEDMLSPGFKVFYLITRGGLQIDISFSRESANFLALDISVVSFQSDIHLSPGVGLGLEF